MNEDALSKELAKIIKEAKERSGQTISFIAEQMNRNDKTIANWISGKASPTVPALFVLFDVLEQPLFKKLIHLKYPHIQEGATINAKRDVLIEYLEKSASNDEIEKLYYVMFGEHGSSWFSQLEEFTALDHLQMKDRVLVAYIIANSYELAAAKDELTNNEVLPNIKMVLDGITKGKEADINGLNYYE